MHFFARFMLSTIVYGIWMETRMQHCFVTFGYGFRLVHAEF